MKYQKIVLYVVLARYGRSTKPFAGVKLTKSIIFSESLIIIISFFNSFIYQ